ncbi:recombinase family protein [Apilactobacillus micheneri]|uniref:recombinase family protein n=1 Tax=Apilactobacillus micheneri TaxID=1899430 RepID=UPI0015E83E2D|nr:recombinase family protein [Apilactobacillus micheneri]
MEFGYARVSSKQQNLSRQINSLKDYGIKENNIITEKQSGKAYENRPELMNLINNTLREGDKIVVTSIDRLSRNYKDTKKLTAMIKAKGAMFVISSFKGFYNDNGMDNDFAGMMNEFLINFMAYQAQQERKNIHERQKQGIAQAKKRGVYKGRPKKYTNGNQSLQKAIKMYLNRDENKMTAEEIARLNGVSRSAIYRNKNMFQKQIIKKKLATK